MASKKLLLPVLGAMAVAGGGGAAYYLMTNATVQGPAAIARYMPDETAVAVSLTFNDKATAQLDKFGTPAARQLVQEQLTKLQKDALKDSGIDFNQDIKPWLGEVMLGIQPTTGKPGAEPELLIAATIKDKGKALSFQNKLKEKVKVEPDSIDYKGYKISKYSPSDKDTKLGKTAKPTFTLLVQDTLLIASTQKSMEAAIDTLKGEPSLASLPQVKSLLSDDLKVENVVARVYMPSPENLAKLMSGDPKANLKLLQAYKSGSAVLGIDSQGVRVRSRLVMDPNHPATVKYPQSPGKIAGYFPAQTFAISSGYDLNNLWKQTITQMEANTPESKQGMADFRKAFTAQTKLDLDKDVMGWMNGEFALGLIQEANAFGGVGGALLVQTSDRAAADKALAQLDTVAKQMGIPVSAAPGSAQPMAATPKPPAGTPALSHGWVDDKTLYLTISPTSAQTLASKPGDNLPNSATYKAVTASLPKTHAGYFYLDMAQTVKVYQGFAPIAADTTAILDSITGIGMTSSPTNNGVTDGGNR